MTKKEPHPLPEIIQDVIVARDRNKSPNNSFTEGEKKTLHQHFKNIAQAQERRSDPSPNLKRFLDRNHALVIHLLRQPERLTEAFFPPDPDPDSDPDGNRLPATRFPQYAKFDNELIRWRVLAVLADAIWDVVNTEKFRRSSTPLSGPLAARFRFLVLSYPFRLYSAEDKSQGRGGAVADPPARDRDRPTQPHTDPNEPRVGEQSLLNNTFGPDSWPELVIRCREARDIWYEHLNSYESNPAFSAAVTPVLEEELWLLTMRKAKDGRPLSLSDAKLGQTEGPTPDDTAVLHSVVVNHLLPRFALGAVWRTVFSARWQRPMVAFVLILAALAIGLGFFGFPAWGAVIAGAAYTVVAFSTLGWGRVWTTPWLLRIPAACALGMLAVLIPSTWFQLFSGGPWTFGVGLGLFFAAFLYLLVQAKNHNVDSSCIALCRVAGLMGFGLAHGLLVTLIGTTFLPPVFSASEAELLTQVSHPWSLPVVLFLAAASSFTFGVFTQLLWDNRPITAPLAHASWTESR